MESSSSSPEDVVESPGQGQGRHGDVNKDEVGGRSQGVGLVRDVKSQDVKEIGSGYNKSKNKVATGKEPGPQEVKNVEDREVVGNGARDGSGLGGKDLAEVQQLETKGQDPENEDKDGACRESIGVDPIGTIMVRVGCGDTILDVGVGGQSEKDDGGELLAQQRIGGFGLSDGHCERRECNQRARRQDTYRPDGLLCTPPFLESYGSTLPKVRIVE